MKSQITLRDIFNALHEKLELEWVAGRSGAGRKFQGRFPGADTQELVGALNLIHPNRIQIIGRAELVYFSGLEKRFYHDTLQKLLNAQPAAIILADGIEVDERLVTLAQENPTPLLRSKLPESQLLNDLQYYLTRSLAERTTEHGVFMEVLGTGVLLTGDPAVGKSELALELISRNHCLIADDAPEFARIAPDIIAGNAPPILQDFLEVRGLGLLNIRAMFGDSAITRQKYLQLVIHLQPMTVPEPIQSDRLRGTISTYPLLGLHIPMVTLPVAPGREMAVLVEAAVRQYMLRHQGYDAADDFIARQKSLLEKKSRRRRLDD